MQLSPAELAMLLPIAIIQIGLMVFALRDLIKRKMVKGGNKWMWGIIIVVFGLIGPIIYFIVGREEE